MFLDELRLQSVRADNLLERAKSGAILVKRQILAVRTSLTHLQMQDLLSFRGLVSLKTSSKNSSEMARLADIDSKNMFELTKKLQKYAATLKKVTWLTSIYLPASFVSMSRAVCASDRD